MTKPNREWQSFEQRWQSRSRIRKFLPLSVLLHGLVLALLILPVYLAQAMKPVAADLAGRAEIQQKQQAIKEAGEEIKAILKEELAEEHLKKFFEDLTEDLIEPDQREAYWEDLLVELDPELVELAELLEEPELFDPIQVEEQIQSLKEQILDQMAKELANEQVAPLREQMAKQAAEVAGQLAKAIRQDIDQKIAQPIRKDFQRLLANEQRATQLALRQIEVQLGVAAKTMALNANNLQRQKDLLAKNAKALDEAKAAGDRKAIQQAQAQIRRQRAAFLAAAKQSERNQSSLKTTLGLMAPLLPSLASRLQDLQQNPGAAAPEKVREIANLASNGNLKQAIASTTDAAKAIEQSTAKIQKLRAAVLLEEATVQATQLRKEIQEQIGSVKSADPKKPWDGDQRAAAKAKAEKAEGQAKALADKLKQAEEEHQKLQTSPHLSQKDKEQLSRLEEPQKQATALRQDLEQGKMALEKSQTQIALAKLNDAGTKLKAVLGKLLQAKARLQIGQSHPEALLAKLAELSKGNLSTTVQNRLIQELKDQSLPQLLNRIDAIVQQRLHGNAEVGKALKEQIQQAVKASVEKELMGIDGGKQFAHSVLSQLPKLPEAISGAEPSPRVADQSAKAEARAQKTIQRLPLLISGHIKRAALFQPGQIQDPRFAARSTLLQKIQGAQKLLSANRREQLGKVNTTALAAAAGRYHDQMRSLRRYSSYNMDVKAYKKMVEALKDRGHIQGEAIAREATNGIASKTDQKNDLRPALILTAPPVEKSKPESKDRSLPRPKFQTHRFAGIPMVTEDAIQVDGSLADWKDIAPLLLDPVHKGRRKPPLNPPRHQTAYLASSRNGLLLAVDVTDLSGKLENHHGLNEFWLNDAIEIYIDSLNTKARHRGEVHTHQFFAFPFGHKDDAELPGYEAKMLTVNGKLQVSRARLPEMKRAAKQTKNGWSMEVLIPWQYIRKGKWEPGRIIGFNLQIDTGTDIYYYWTCAKRIMSSMKPDTWGDMQLLGSDAIVSLVDANGKPVQPSVTPGQPIRVQVEDPDMNLSDQKQEKVSLTLRTASGQSKVLILEEDPKHPGRFYGSIGTRLSIGSRTGPWLEIFEGEKVTAEYIDQVRSYGERNVPVHAHLTVGSLGTRLGAGQ